MATKAQDPKGYAIRVLRERVAYYLAVVLTGAIDVKNLLFDRIGLRRFFEIHFCLIHTGISSRSTASEVYKVFLGLAVLVFGSGIGGIQTHAIESEVTAAVFSVAMVG